MNLSPSAEDALLLETAVEAVREAGRIALDKQRSLAAIRLKGVKDLVTEADLACDEAIRALLEARFPDHDIETEEAEGVKRGGAVTWHVDPIDGTINYSRGIPLWGISVGAARGGRMAAGAVFLPALNELFTAVRGGGAFLNGSRIFVSEVTKTSDSILSHGDLNVGGEAGRIRDLNGKNFALIRAAADKAQRVKCLGSAVVEGAYVAAGRMEAYAMAYFHAWDVAAASLLVEEAGGTVTTLTGAPFSLSSPDALFTNGKVHAELASAFAAALPGGHV